LHSTKTASKSTIANIAATNTHGTTIDAPSLHPHHATTHTLLTTNTHHTA
jgi:hypothetical protein